MIRAPLGRHYPRTMHGKSVRLPAAAPRVPLPARAFGNHSAARLRPAASIPGVPVGACGRAAPRAISPAELGTGAAFSELARRWKAETEHLSSAAIFAHPAYQQIIGLGPDAIPLLLHDLQQTGAHWFWALRAITGENPVPREDAGYVGRMADAWIDWGARRGLV